MPRTGKKLKTHRGAAKRFRTTASGKVVRKRSGKRHLLSHKNSRRKRGYSLPAEVSAPEQTMVKRLIPYGGKV